MRSAGGRVYRQSRSGMAGREGPGERGPVRAAAGGGDADYPVQG